MELTLYGNFFSFSYVMNSLRSLALITIKIPPPKKKNHSSLGGAAATEHFSLP